MKMSFVVEARIEIIPWQDCSVLEEGPVIHCENLLLIYNDLVIEDLFDSALSINQWVLEDDSDNNSSVISPNPGALDLLRTQLEQVLIPLSAQKSPDSKEIDNDRRSEGSSNPCQSDETCCSNGNITEPEKSELTWSSNGTGYEFAHVRLESLSDDVFYSENLKKCGLSLHDVNSLSSIDYSLSGSSTTQDSYRLSSTTNSSSLDSNQSSDLSDFSSLHIQHLFDCSSESEVDRTEEFMSSPDSLQFEYKRSDKNRFSQDSESSLDVIFENMEPHDSAPGSMLCNKNTTNSLDQTQTPCSNKEEPPPTNIEITQSDNCLKKKDPDLSHDSRSADQGEHGYTASGNCSVYEKDIATNSGKAQTMPSDVPCVLDTELHETDDNSCDYQEQVDTHSITTVHCHKFELEETGIYGHYLQDSEQNKNVPSSETEKEILKYNAQNYGEEIKTCVPSSDLIAEELKQSETVSKSDFPCFDGLDIADDEESCPMPISEQSQDTIQTVVSALNQDTIETIQFESRTDLEAMFEENAISDNDISIEIPQNIAEKNNLQKEISEIITDTAPHVVQTVMNSLACESEKNIEESHNLDFDSDEDSGSNENMVTIDKKEVDNNKDASVIELDVSSHSCTANESYKGSPEHRLSKDDNQSKELSEHQTNVPCVDLDIPQVRETEDIEIHSSDEETTAHDGKIKCSKDNFISQYEARQSSYFDIDSTKACSQSNENKENLSNKTLVSDKSETDDREHVTDNAEEDPKEYNFGLGEFKESEYESLEEKSETDTLKYKSENIQADIPESESQQDYQDNEISTTDKTENPSSLAGQYTCDTHACIRTESGVQSLNTQTFVEETLIPFLDENYQVFEQDNTVSENQTDSQLIENKIPTENKLNKVGSESEESVLTNLEAKISKAVYEKDEDTRELCREIVSTTKLQETFKDATKLHEEIEDPNEIQGEIENTLELHKTIEDPNDLFEVTVCTPELHDNLEHTAESCEKSEDTTGIRDELEDIIELHEEIEDKTEICEEMEDTTELHIEIEDKTEACEEMEDTTELHEEIEDSSELCKNTTELHEYLSECTFEFHEELEETSELFDEIIGTTEATDGEDTANVYENFEDVTKLRDQIETTTELCEQIEDTADLRDKIEDTTELQEVLHKETTKLHKEDPIELQKEIRNSPKLLAEIEDSTEVCEEMEDITELSVAIEYETACDAECLKSISDFVRDIISESEQRIQNTHITHVDREADEKLETNTLEDDIKIARNTFQVEGNKNTFEEPVDHKKMPLDDLEVHYQKGTKNTEERLSDFEFDGLTTEASMISNSSASHSVKNKGVITVDFSDIENEIYIDKTFQEGLEEVKVMPTLTTVETMPKEDIKLTKYVNDLSSKLKTDNRSELTQPSNFVNVSEDSVDTEEIEAANTFGGSKINTDASLYEFKDVKSETNHTVNSGTTCLSYAIETDKPYATKNIVEVYKGELNVIGGEFPHEECFQASCAVEDGNELVSQLNSTGNLKNDQIVFEKETEIKEVCSEIVEDMMNAIFEINNQDGSKDVDMIRKHSDLTPERDMTVKELVPEHFRIEELELEDLSQSEQQANTCFECEDLSTTYVSSQEMHRKNGQGHCAINTASLCKNSQFTNANTLFSVTSIPSAKLVENTEIRTESINEAFDTQANETTANETEATDIEICTDGSTPALEKQLDTDIYTENEDNLESESQLYSSFDIFEDTVNLQISTQDVQNDSFQDTDLNAIISKNTHSQQVELDSKESCSNEIEQFRNNFKEDNRKRSDKDETEKSELSQDSFGLDTEECSLDENETKAQGNAILDTAFEKQNSAEKEFLEDIISEIETDMRNVEDEINDNEPSVECNGTDRTHTPERSKEVQETNAIVSVLPVSDNDQSTDVCTQDNSQALAYDFKADREYHLENEETLVTMCIEKDDTSIDTEIKMFLEDIISEIEVDMKSIDEDSSTENIQSESTCIPERNKEIPIEKEITFALPFSDNLTKDASTQDNNQGLAGDLQVGIKDTFENIETSITECNETVNNSTEEPVKVNESLVENVESSAERGQTVPTENESVLILPFADKYQPIGSDNAEDNINVSAGVFEDKEYQLENVEECVETNDRSILKAIQINQLPVEKIEHTNESTPEQDVEKQMEHEISQPSPKCEEENLNRTESVLEESTDKAHISLSTNKDLMSTGIKPDSCYAKPNESVPEICSIITKTNAQHLNNLLDDNDCSNECKTIETEFDHGDDDDFTDLDIAKNECDIQEIVIKDIWKLFKDRTERKESEGDKDHFENVNHNDKGATYERHLDTEEAGNEDYFEQSDYSCDVGIPQTCTLECAEESKSSAVHEVLKQKKDIEDNLDETTFKEDACEETDMEIGINVDVVKYKESIVKVTEDEGDQDDVCVHLTESQGEYFSEVASNLSEVNSQNETQLVEEIYTELDTFNRDDIPFDIQKGRYPSEASSLGIEKFLSEAEENIITERHSLACIEEESEVCVDDADIENYTYSDDQPYDTSSYLMPIMEESYNDIEESSENNGTIDQNKEFQKRKGSEYTALEQSGTVFEIETNLLNAKAEFKDSEKPIETQVSHDESELEKEKGNVKYSLNDTTISSHLPACQQGVSLNKPMIQHNSKENKASGIDAEKTEFDEPEIIPEKIESHEALSANQMEQIFGIQIADCPISDRPDITCGHSRIEHENECWYNPNTDRNMHDLEPDDAHHRAQRELTTAVNNMQLYKLEERIKRNESIAKDNERLNRCCDDSTFSSVLLPVSSYSLDIQKQPEALGVSGTNEVELECEEPEIIPMIIEKQEALPTNKVETIFDIQSSDRSISHKPFDNSRSEHDIYNRDCPYAIKPTVFEITSGEKHQIAKQEEATELKCMDLYEPEVKCQEEEPDQPCQYDKTEQRCPLEEPEEVCQEGGPEQTRQEGEPERTCQVVEQEQLCQQNEAVLVFEEQEPGKTFQEEPELLYQEEEPEQKCQNDESEQVRQEEKSVLMFQKEESDQSCEEEEPEVKCSEEKPKQTCKKYETEHAYGREEPVLIFQEEEQDQSCEEEILELLCYTEEPKKNYQKDESVQVYQMEEPVLMIQEEEPEKVIEENISELMCQNKEPEQNYQKDEPEQVFQEEEPVQICQEEEPQQKYKEEEHKQTCKEEELEIRCKEDKPEYISQEDVAELECQDMTQDQMGEPEQQCEEEPEQTCQREVAKLKCLVVEPEQMGGPEQMCQEETAELKCLGVEPKQMEEPEQMCQEETSELECQDVELEHMGEPEQMFQGETAELECQKEEPEQKCHEKEPEQKCQEDNSEQMALVEAAELEYEDVELRHREKPGEKCIEEEFDKKCQEEKVEEKYHEETPGEQCHEETPEQNCLDEESEERYQEETPEEKCQEETPEEKCQEETPEEKCQEEESEERYQEETPEEKFQDETPEQKCQEETPEENCQEETPVEKFQNETPEQKCQEETPEENCQEETPEEKFQDETPEQKCQEETPEEKCQEETPEEKYQEETPEEKLQDETPEQIFKEDEQQQETLEKTIEQDIQEEEVGQEIQEKNPQEEEPEQMCKEEQDKQGEEPEEKINEEKLDIEIQKEEQEQAIQEREPEKEIQTQEPEQETQAVEQELVIQAEKPENTVQEEEHEQEIQAEDPEQVIQTEKLEQVIEEEELEDEIQAHESKQLIKIEDTEHVIQTEETEQEIQSKELENGIQVKGPEQVIQEEESEQLIQEEKLEQEIQAEAPEQDIQTQESEQVIQEEKIEQEIPAEDPEQDIQTLEPEQEIQEGEPEHVLENTEQEILSQELENGKQVEGPEQVNQEEESEQLIQEEKIEQEIQEEDPEQDIQTQEPEQMIQEENIEQEIQAEDPEHDIQTQEPGQVIQEEKIEHAIQAEDPEQDIQTQEPEQLIQEEKIKQEIQEEDPGQDIQTLEPEQVIREEKIEQESQAEGPNQGIQTQEPEQVIQEEEQETHPHYLENIKQEEETEQEIQTLEPKQDTQVEEPGQVIQAQKPDQVIQEEKIEQEVPAEYPEQDIQTLEPEQEIQEGEPEHVLENTEQEILSQELENGKQVEGPEQVNQEEESEQLIQEEKIEQEIQEEDPEQDKQTQEPEQMIQEENIEQEIQAEDPEHDIQTQEPGQVIQEEKIEHAIQAEDPEQDIQTQEPEQLIQEEKIKQEIQEEDPGQDIQTLEPEQVIREEKIEQESQAEGPNQGTQTQEPEQVIQEEEQETHPHYPENIKQEEETEKEVQTLEPKQDTQVEEPGQVIQAQEPDQVIQETHPHYPEDIKQEDETEQEIHTQEPKQDTQVEEPGQVIQSQEPDQVIQENEQEQEIQKDGPEQEMQEDEPKLEIQKAEQEHEIQEEVLEQLIQAEEPLQQIQKIQEVEQEKEIQTQEPEQETHAVEQELVIQAEKPEHMVPEEELEQEIQTQEPKREVQEEELVQEIQAEDPEQVIQTEELEQVMEEEELEKELQAHEQKQLIKMEDPEQVIQKEETEQEILSQELENGIQVEGPEQVIKEEESEQLIQEEKLEQEIQAEAPEQDIQTQEPEQVIQEEKIEQEIQEEDPEQDIQTQEPEQLIQEEKIEQEIQAEDPDQDIHTQDPDQLIQEEKIDQEIQAEDPEQDIQTQEPEQLIQEEKIEQEIQEEDPGQDIQTQEPEQLIQEEKIEHAIQAEDPEQDIQTQEPEQLIQEEKIEQEIQAEDPEQNIQTLEPEQLMQEEKIEQEIQAEDPDQDIQTQEPEQLIQEEKMEQKIQAEDPEQDIQTQEPEQLIQEEKMEQKIQAGDPKQDIQTQEPEQLIQEEKIEQEIQAEDPDQDIQTLEPEREIQEDEPEHVLEEAEQEIQSQELENRIQVEGPEQVNQEEETEQLIQEEKLEQEIQEEDREQNLQTKEPEQVIQEEKIEQEKQAADPEQDIQTLEPKQVIQEEKIEQEIQTEDPEQDIQTQEPEQLIQEEKIEQEIQAEDPDQDIHTQEPDQLIQEEKIDQEIQAEDPEQDIQTQEPEQLIQEEKIEQEIQAEDPEQNIQTLEPEQLMQEEKIEQEIQAEDPDQDIQTQEPEQLIQEEKMEQKIQAEDPEQDIQTQEPEQLIQEEKMEQKIQAGDPKQDIQTQEPEQLIQEEKIEQEIQAEDPDQDIQTLEPEREIQEDEPEHVLEEAEQEIQSQELENRIQVEGPEQVNQEEETEQLIQEEKLEQEIQEEDREQNLQTKEPEQVIREEKIEQEKQAADPEQDIQTLEPEQVIQEEKIEQEKQAADPEQDIQTLEPKQVIQEEKIEQEIQAEDPGQEIQSQEPEQVIHEEEQETHPNAPEDMKQEEETEQEIQTQEPKKETQVEEPGQVIQAQEPDHKVQAQKPEQVIQEDEQEQVIQEDGSEQKIQEYEPKQEIQKAEQEHEIQEEVLEQLIQAKEPLQQIQAQELEQVIQEDEPEQEIQMVEQENEIQEEVQEQVIQAMEPLQQIQAQELIQVIQKDKLEQEIQEAEQEHEIQEEVQEQAIQAEEPLQQIQAQELKQVIQIDELEQEIQEAEQEREIQEEVQEKVIQAMEPLQQIQAQELIQVVQKDKLEQEIQEAEQEHEIQEEVQEQVIQAMEPLQQIQAQELGQVIQEGEPEQAIQEERQEQVIQDTEQENEKKVQEPEQDIQAHEPQHEIKDDEPEQEIQEDEQDQYIEEGLPEEEKGAHEQEIQEEEQEQGEQAHESEQVIQTQEHKQETHAQDPETVIAKLKQPKVNNASIRSGTHQESSEFEEPEDILEKKESQEAILANQMEQNNQTTAKSNFDTLYMSCENVGIEHDTDSNDLNEKKLDEEILTTTASTDHSKSKVQEKEGDDCPEKQSRDNGMSYDNDDDVFSDDLDDDEERDTEDFPCSVTEGGPVGPGARLQTLDQDFTKPKRLSIINEETDNDLNETIVDEADLPKHEEQTIDVSSKEGKDGCEKSAENFDKNNVKEKHVIADFTNASTCSTSKFPDQGISQKQKTSDKESKAEELLDTNRGSETDNRAHTETIDESTILNVAPCISENQSNRTGDKDGQLIKRKDQAFEEKPEEDNLPMTEKVLSSEKKCELSTSSQGNVSPASQANSNTADDDKSFSSNYEFLSCENEKKSTKEIEENCEPEYHHSKVTKDIVKEEIIQHRSDVNRKQSNEFTVSASTTQDRNNQAKSDSSKDEKPDLTIQFQAKLREDKEQTSTILKKTDEKPKTAAEKVANKKKDIMEPNRISEKLSPGEGISQTFMSNLTADLSRRVEYNRGWRLHSSSSLSDSSSDRSETPSSKMISGRQNSMAHTNNNKKIIDNKKHNQDSPFDRELDKDRELSEHYDDRHKDKQHSSRRKPETLSFESGEYIISHDESCSDHSPDEQSIDNVRENPYRNMSKEEKRSTFRQASTQYNTVIYVPKKTAEAEVWQSRESDDGPMSETHSNLRKSVDETSKLQESRGGSSSREYLTEVQNLPNYGREQEVHMMQPDDNQKTPHTYDKRSDSYPDRSTGKNRPLHRHRSLQSNQDNLYDSRDQSHSADEQHQAFKQHQASRDTASDYDVPVHNRQSRSMQSNLESPDQEVEDVWVVNRANRRASADSRRSSGDSRRASVESRASVDSRALVDSRRASVESRASVDSRALVDSRRASLDSRASLDGRRVSLDREEAYDLPYKKRAQRSDSESSGSVQSRADHRQRSDLQSPGVRVARSDSQSSGSLQGRRPSDQHSLFTKPKRSDSESSGPGQNRPYARRMADQQSPNLGSRRSDSESSESFQERVYERRMSGQHSPSINARRSDSESSGSHASKTGVRRMSDQKSPSVKAVRSDSESSEPQQNRIYNRRLSDQQSSSLQSKRSDSESSGSLQDRGYTRRPSDQQLQHAGIRASQHKMIHEVNNQQRDSNNYWENEAESEMTDYPHGYDPHTRQSRDTTLGRQSPHVSGRRLSMEEKSKSEAKLWSQVEDVKPPDQLPYELTQSYDSSMTEKHFGQSLEENEKKGKVPRAHFSDEYIKSREVRNDQNDDFESEQQKKQKREFHQDYDAGDLLRRGQRSKENYDYVQSDKLPRKSYSETHRQGPDSSGNQPGSRRDSQVDFSVTQTGSRRGSRLDRPDDQSSLRRSSQNYIAGSQSGVRRGSHVQTGSQADSIDVQSRSRSRRDSKVDSMNKQQQYLDYPEADYEQQGRVQTSSRQPKMPSVDQSPSRPDIQQTAAENLKYSRQRYSENEYSHSGREREVSFTNQTNKKPSRPVNQEEKLAYTDPQRSAYPNKGRRDSNLKASPSSQTGDGQTLWLVDDQGNRVKVDKYLYEMKIKDDEDRAQFDRRRSISDRGRANTRDNLTREDDARRDTYRSVEKVGERKPTEGNYRTTTRGSRVKIKDGPLSLTDAYGQMENHNNNMSGHALSQSTNHLSGSMTSLSNKHAPSASPSRQSTLQKQQSLQSVTSEMNGGPREEDRIKFERLKNLSEDDLMVKIKEIVSHFDRLEEFHRGDGMRIQKMLGDMYWDYTHMREMIGDCMAESGYAGLAMNMLKTLNGIGIFKNDDVWFPTYYTYNTMWNFTDASSKLALALSEHDAVRLLTLNCGHKPYIQALHSKNVYYVIKASLSVLHNIARNSGMKHLFDDNKTSETIMPFLESDDEMLKILATLTISNIVDEEENKALITETGTIKCMVSWIEKALGLPRRRYKGFTPQELTEGLNKLAVNDNNKLKIVEEGALLLFLKMLQHDDVREQSSAARVIWTLSFDKEVREKIKEVAELMAQLEKLTESTNKSLQTNSTGALWVIKGENDVSKENEDEPVPKRRAKSARTKTHVFLSYSWSDKETVLQIRDRLRAEGYALWIDIEKMGGSTLEAMSTAVENSAVVLICMSEKYKHSPNCRTEAEYTFQLRKDYIPIMMQKKYRPDGWLGIILGAKLYFDFSGKYPFDKSFQGLVKELRGRGKVTPNQTPGETNDNTDAAIIHSTSLSSHASYGTPVHQVPSNSVIHTMGQEELIKWLRNIKLTDCIPAFMEFDGRLLMQLKMMRSEAPEFFYQCLEKRLNMSLIEILKFTRALEELH